MGAPIRKPIRPAARQGSAAGKKAAGKAPVLSRRKTKDTLHLRIDDALKAEATKTLKAIGFTLSDALLLFLHRVVAEKALPLRLDVPVPKNAVSGDVPNAETRAAIDEARSGHLPMYQTAEELFNALEKGGDQ